MSKIFNFFQGGWQDDLPPASSSPEHRLHPGACWLHPGPPRVGDPLVHPATWDTCCGGRGHWRGATPLSGLPGEAAPGMHACIGSDSSRPHLPPETHMIIYLEINVCVEDITMYFLFRSQHLACGNTVNSVMDEQWLSYKIHLCNLHWIFWTLAVVKSTTIYMFTI